MRKSFALVFLCLLGISQASAQQVDFNKAAATDPAELAKAMPALAKEVIAKYKDDNRET